MTTLISAQALRLDAHDGFLFHELAFTLRQGDRIGLVGHNGCGKSSLLGLLAGTRVASAGTIHMARACRLQHVEQHLPAALASLSLYDALLAPVLEQPELHWRVDSLLAELGFDLDTAQVPVHALSGGQHTRLLLGRALLQEPNVLLLDEPSNHLDLPSLLWLEQFLLRWRGAFILTTSACSTTWPRAAGSCAMAVCTISSCLAAPRWRRWPKPIWPLSPAMLPSKRRSTACRPAARVWRCGAASTIT